MDDTPTDSAARPTSRAGGRWDVVRRGAGDAVRREALDAALVTAVIAALIWPALGSLRTRYIGSMDAHYAGWLAWRVGHLGHFPFVTRIPDALVPAGIDLRLLDGLLPTFAGGLLIRLFGVFLGYNIMLIVGMAANHLAARRLATVLGAGPGVARLCGLAYLAAPVFAGPLQSFPSFLWAFGTPMALAHVVEVVTGRRALSPLRLAGWLVVAYLCSIYHLVFGGFVVVAVGLGWPASPLRTRAGLRRLAEAAAIVLLVLAPFGVARLSYDQDESRAGNPATVRVGDSVSLSADLVDPLIPPPDARILGGLGRPSFAERDLEPFRGMFVAPVLLVGIVLVIRRRPTGWQPLVASAAVLWVLSWGPVLHVAGHGIGTSRPWWPYRLLLAVPGLGALRAPYRVGFALAVVAIACLALGLSGPRRRGAAIAGGGAPVDAPWRQRLAVGVAAAAVLVGWWPAPSTSGSTATPALDAVFRRLALDSPGAVLVAPWGCLFNDAYPISWQIEHRQASVGCDTSTSATPFYSRLDVWRTNQGLAALSCDPTRDAIGRATPFTSEVSFDSGALGDLRRLGVRWVVLDRGLAAFIGCPRTDVLRESLSGFARLGGDDRYDVYDLLGGP